MKEELQKKSSDDDGTTLQYFNNHIINNNNNNNNRKNRMNVENQDYSFMLLSVMKLSNLFLCFEKVNVLSSYLLCLLSESFDS